MLSEKGKELKVLNNYKFMFATSVKNGKRWRCTTKLCNAFIVTDTSGENIVRYGGFHAHNPHQYIARDFLANQVKSKAKADISAKPLKLVQRESLSVPQFIRQELRKNDLVAARRRIYDARR